jgi:hypothetical protein
MEDDPRTAQCASRAAADLHVGNAVHADFKRTFAAALPPMIRALMVCPQLARANNINTARIAEHRIPRVHRIAPIVVGLQREKSDSKRQSR